MSLKSRQTYRALNNFKNFKIRVLIESMGIGLFTGFIIVLYRILLNSLTGARNNLLIFLNSSSIVYTVLWFVLLGFVGFGTGYFIEKFPMIKGSGIPQVKGVLMNKLDMKWFQELLTKFFGGIIGPGLGLSLGREGPSVQLGSQVGMGMSRIFKRKDTEEKYLVTSGASAGLAAAFNAPLAGVIFSLEELHKSFTPIILICVMASSLVADFISKYFLGVNPAFEFEYLATMPFRNYIYLVLLGVICGLLGIVFNYGIAKSQDLYVDRYHIRDRFKPIIPFLLVGVLGIYLPEVLGGGHSLIEEVSRGEFAVLSLLIIIVVKFLFTIVSYGSGAPGGIFLPLLVIGALIGKLFGLFAVEFFGVSTVYILNFTVLAMAAYFTAITKAPITGTILLLEMTSSFNHLLELIVVAMTAYMVVELLEKKSIYDILLEKMLYGRKADEILYDENEKIIVEVCIPIGSKVCNQIIKDIAWPKGSVLVSVVRSEDELIPDENKKILQGDRLIFMTDKDHVSDVKHELLSWSECEVDEPL